MFRRYVVFECRSDEELNKLLLATINAGATPLAITHDLANVSRPVETIHINSNSGSNASATTELATEAEGSTDEPVCSKSLFGNGEMAVKEENKTDIVNLNGTPTTFDEHVNNSLSMDDSLPNFAHFPEEPSPSNLAMRRPYQRKRSSLSRNRLNRSTASTVPPTTAKRTGGVAYEEAQCTVCGAVILAKGKDYYAKSAHAIIHTDIKRYHCPICKTFGSRHRSEIARHMDKMHEIKSTGYSIKEQMSLEDTLKLEEFVRICFNTTMNNEKLHEKIIQTQQETNEQMLIADIKKEETDA